MISEIILGVVIVALLVERYFHARDTGRQINDLNKVLASRTPADYLQYKAPDTKENDTIVKEPDEVPVEGISDDEFFEAIKK